MSKWFKFLIAVEFLLIFCRAIAFADYSGTFSDEFDIVAPQYWDTHQAFYGKIENLYTSKTDDVAIVFNLIQKITPEIQITNDTLFLSQTILCDYYVGPDCYVNPDWRSHLRIGASFLVLKGNQQAQLLKFIETKNDTNFVNSLVSIEKLNEQKDDQFLLESAVSKDELVSKYCLNQILFRPEVAYRKKNLKALAVLRDDAKRPAEIRIDAEEAILKLTKGFTNTEGNYDGLRWRFSAVNPSLNDEYSWIKKLMSEKPPASNADMDYLADRLLDFQSFKLDNAHLLVSLANDGESSVNGQRMQLSMCSKLNDPRLFDHHPYTTGGLNRQDALGCVGPNVEFTFNTCLNLIKDSDPRMREVAAFNACSLARCAMPEEGKVLKQRAKEAIQSALSSEKNQMVLLELKRTLKDLDTL